MNKLIKKNCCHDVFGINEVPGKLSRGSGEMNVLLERFTRPNKLRFIIL